MHTYPYHTLVAVVAVLLFLGCGETSEPIPTSDASAVPTVDSTTLEPPPPPLAAGEELTAWVDGLFIRAKPEKGGEILQQISGGTALTYTGKASPSPETIVLRGIAFSEPWLQVRTAEGTEGWVFGGALQRKGMEKGNGYRSDEQFDLPKFGDFDLTGWESQPATETTGGDATNVISAYTRGNERLTIRRTDTGEYGYERVFTLTDTAGKLLKTRDFRYQTSPDRMLVEIVTDYTRSPAVQYRRKQALDAHFTQLNARPEMATGPWETRTAAQ